MGDADATLLQLFPQQHILVAASGEALVEVTDLEGCPLDEKVSGTEFPVLLLLTSAAV